MSIIKLYPYKSLTDEKLLDFVMQEMDKLKMLFSIGDFEQMEKTIPIVNQLIIEIKRRNIYLEKPLLMKRIFIEQ